jgi:hypothetical protein
MSHHRITEYFLNSEGGILPSLMAFLHDEAAAGVQYVDAMKAWEAYYRGFLNAITADPTKAVPFERMLERDYPKKGRKKVSTKEIVFDKTMLLMSGPREWSGTCDYAAGRIAHS